MTDIPLSNAPAPRVIYARYTGTPFYFAGLGACDLTRAEWDEADPVLTKMALKLKLYEIDPAAAQTLEAQGAAADADPVQESEK